MGPITYLHIQAAEDTPAHVLELVGETVRIGCGTRCEVRLDDPRLAEVQCLLKKRGMHWHLLPVGPSGRLFVDGRPIEGQCVLKEGSVIRVGSHRLVLKGSNSPTAPLGSFEHPIPVEAVQEAPAAPPPREPAAAGLSIVRPIPAAPVEAEPPDSWHDRLASRQRSLRDRERERRVAARWRAAGEHAQSRIPPSSPAPGAPLRPTPRIRVQPDPPAPETPAGERPARRPTGFVLPAATAEGRPSIWTRITEDAAPPSTAEPSPPPSEPAGPTPCLAPTFAEDPEPEDLADELDDPAQPSCAEDHGMPGAPATEPAEAHPPVEPPRPPAADHGPFVAHTAQQVEWSWNVAASTDRRASAPPPPVFTNDAEWPSARELLAAHRGASSAGPARADGPRSIPAAPVGPVPTSAHAPDSWRVPAWAGVGPVGGAVLSTLGIAVFLCWTWCRDDRIAGLLTQRLADPAAASRGAIEVPDGAGAAWWATTSGHLFLRAEASSRNVNDPDSAEQVRFHLEAARSAAPLDRSVRLAMAADESSALGLSHDIVSLRRTGQALLKAGKESAALEAMRRAVAMATRADLHHCPPPEFDEDAGVRRFSLPREVLISGILRDALGATPGPDDLRRIEAIVPDSPVAMLAAYRVLRQRGSMGAETLLPRILEAAVAPEDVVGLAAQAEALAYRSQWGEAAERYQEALAGIPRELLARRALALNLAEIQARLGNLDAAREAWEDARGPDPSDPINVRLVEARQRLGESARPGLLSLPTTARRDERVAPATYRPRQ